MRQGEQLPIFHSSFAFGSGNDDGTISRGSFDGLYCILNISHTLFAAIFAAWIDRNPIRLIAIPSIAIHTRNRLS